MAIGWDVIIPFAVGLLLLYLSGYLLLMPLKIIVRLLANGIIGGIALYVINILFGPMGFSIGINPITALVAGVLGIPGVGALVILKLLL